MIQAVVRAGLWVVSRTAARRNNCGSHSVREWIQNNGKTVCQGKALHGDHLLLGFIISKSSFSVIRLLYSYVNFPIVHMCVVQYAQQRCHLMCTRLATLVERTLSLAEKLKN
jgi:hypothetical protein